MIPHNETEPLTAAQLERRRLLQLMAASAALAGAGCSGPPPENILPFSRAPEGATPAEALFYASALEHDGFGQGVLIETHGGRPTKIEGNPLHPATLGASSPHLQAAVLQLWDPARSAAPLLDGKVSSWAAFDRALATQLRDSDGRGLRVLTRPSASPWRAAQLAALRQRFPRYTHHEYAPLNRDAAHRGTTLAFGRPLDTVHRFDQARLIVALDADFLQGGAASVRHARDFAAGRTPLAGRMSRVYAAESHPGLIGAAADRRIALSPPAIEALIYRLGAAFGIGPGGGGAAPTPWEDQLRADLQRHAGRCLLVAGETLPAAAHALVQALNERFGQRGVTHDYIVPPDAGDAHSLMDLSEAAQRQDVQTLLILDGNPAYDAYSDVEFSALLRRVPFTAHSSLYVDETSAQCHWHLPATHALEQWGDTRAFDGTAAIVQPAIAPLVDGRSAGELLLSLLARNSSPRESLRASWRDRLGGRDFEPRWNEMLRTGVVAGTQSPAVADRLRLAGLPPLSSAAGNDSIAVIFTADQAVHDGQWANSGWLQELPRSFSKLTWGNAAQLSPATARRLGVATGDMLALGGTTDRPAVRAGVLVMTAHADDCISLPLGYGRRRAGPVGDGVGFDANVLRRSDAATMAYVSVLHTAGHWSPALTQTQAQPLDRADVLRGASLAAFLREPQSAAAGESVPDRSLYPESKPETYRWGMSIDLNACIGCNACTIACQAENNIPVVGREQVALGRVMHWIRVDRYEVPAPAAAPARTRFQPVPCMHCEHAPCEEVCPVGATVHDSQGLNLQIYNRCVGTRFCSNNCPYKVRRFNFLQYTDPAPLRRAERNPEVTVRQRGVMEKCTYCVQRIERARIEADRLGRPVHDGEVVTACQAACPTQAIRFGNMNDPDADVVQAKQSPRNFTLLAELNTRPHTTYLARIDNDDAEEAG